MTEITKFPGAEPLVPMIEVEDMSPRMREAAERALKRAGRIPNSARRSPMPAISARRRAASSRRLY